MVLFSPQEIEKSNLSRLIRFSEKVKISARILGGMKEKYAATDKKLRAKINFTGLIVQLFFLGRDAKMFIAYNPR